MTTDIQEELTADFVAHIASAMTGEATPYVAPVMPKPRKCNRCLGLGYIAAFHHINRGLCFACLGTGVAT